MKRVLILLTVLGLIATPVMAKQQLEAAPVQKHATAKKHHVKTRKEKKHLKKKMAKRSARKQKIAV
jgi:hypothetical protein